MNNDCANFMVRLMGSEFDIPHKGGTKKELSISTNLSTEDFTSKNLIDTELYEYALTLLELDCIFFKRLLSK